MFLSSNPFRRVVILLLYLFIPAIHSQQIKPVIGIHGGINFTQPRIVTHYEIITNLNNEEPTNHVYNKIFKNFGHQIGFSLFLNFNKHFSIGIIPELASYSFGYQSVEEFNNSQGDSVLNITNNVTSKLNYFSIPLLIQYKFKEGPFIPYVFAGGAYSILRNAQQSVDVLSNLQSQSGSLEFSQTTTNNYSSGFIKSKLSSFAGIGASYEFEAFTLALDVSYWFGFNNIVNEKKRYSNSNITGSTYELPDDLKLNHLVLNASVLFPINKNEGKKGSLDCVPFKTRKK